MVFPADALGPVFGPVHGAAELAASFTAAVAFARPAVQTPAALAVVAVAATNEPERSATPAANAMVAFLLLRIFPLYLFIPCFPCSYVLPLPLPLVVYETNNRQDQQRPTM